LGTQPKIVKNFKSDRKHIFDLIFAYFLFMLSKVEVSRKSKVLSLKQEKSSSSKVKIKPIEVV